MTVKRTIDHTPVPVHIWTEDVTPEAVQQLEHVACLPFVHSHVAAMPDVHVGVGSTIGSVIPTRGAIVPAAVGVDIGCGMLALRCMYVQLNMSTEYEWDEAKRRSNLAKHAVNFAVMDAFEWETAQIEPDDYADESRWIATGFIGLHLHVVVFTERGDRTRIVSLRRARPSEEKDYAKYHRR